MMHRRRFLKLSTAAGLSLLTPYHHAIASEPLQPFEGPYWLTINLAGAWDTTLFCDPKGDVEDGTNKGVVNQSYTQQDIVTHDYAGQSIRLAPGIRVREEGGSYYHFTPQNSNAPVHIIDHLAQRGLTIINGIDAGLTNHQFGEQLAMSGSTLPNFPTLAALIAYQRMVEQPGFNAPMPLLSFGGYDGTFDLLPATRLNKLQVLGQITRPNYFGTGETNIAIHRPHTQDLINQALQARKIRVMEREKRPSVQQAMSQLFMARSNEHHVKELLTHFDFDVFENLANLKKQAYVALKSFKAGLSVSGNLILTGWDTHSRNDLYQTNRFYTLFSALVYIKDLAEELGIADSLNIVVGSDFGRTPHYSAVGNPDSGKDHHSVTSWMTMLWHQNRDQGLRVIGQTNDAVVASPLDQQLNPSAQGTVLTPAMIHHELRLAAGLRAGSIADQFPLDYTQTLPIWSS